MIQNKNNFLETIYNIRTLEHLILFNKVLEIPQIEDKEVIAFLEDEYEREILNYPFIAPKFDSNAGIWAAKMLFFASQLLLYREHSVADLSNLFPKFYSKIDASIMLSADLSLRFLPQIVLELKRIDSEDALIPILQEHLQMFHYSAIGFDIEILNFDFLNENQCLKQLYMDRIIERRAIKLVSNPEIKMSILESLGNYKSDFWAELDLI
jgi:hypothetical protein